MLDTRMPSTSTMLIIMSVIAFNSQLYHLLSSAKLEDSLNFYQKIEQPQLVFWENTI